MDTTDEEIWAVISRIALAGDGLVLGVGVAVLALRTWYRYLTHAKALAQLHRTPLTAIRDLRAALISDSQPQPPSNSTSTQQQQQQPTLVIIRGKVNTNKSSHSITAQNAPTEKAVVVSRTQTCLYNEWRGLFGWSSDWRGLFGWGSLKEHVTVSMRKVPFVLVDENGFRGSAFAHIDIDDSKHPLPLVTVYHQLHPVKASTYTLLQAIFGRGYPVGILNEEKILPLGKEVTAVGILDMTVDGQPVIKSSRQQPIFLTELTRDQLMIQLATDTKVLFWSGVVISTCAIGVLGYSLYRNWKRYKDWRLQRVRRRELQRLAAERTEEDVSDVPDGELCVICLLRRRRAAFLNCGHLVCCMHCAQLVEEDGNGRCPVCRSNVSGTIRIYDA